MMHHMSEYFYRQSIIIIFYVPKYVHTWLAEYIIVITSLSTIYMAVQTNFQATKLAGNSYSKVTEHNLILPLS